MVPRLSPGRGGPRQSRSGPFAPPRRSWGVGANGDAGPAGTSSRAARASAPGAWVPPARPCCPLPSGLCGAPAPAKPSWTFPPGRRPGAQAQGTSHPRAPCPPVVTQLLSPPRAASGGDLPPRGVPGPDALGCVSDDRRQSQLWGREGRPSAACTGLSPTTARPHPAVRCAWAGRPRGPLT